MGTARIDPFNSPPGEPRKSATSIKDPVCGRLIEPALAGARLEHNGGIKYFCGAPCKELFEANPGHYVNIPASVLELPDACIIDY